MYRNRNSMMLKARAVQHIMVLQPKISARCCFLPEDWELAGAFCILPQEQFVEEAATMLVHVMKQLMGEHEVHRHRSDSSRRRFARLRDLRLDWDRYSLRQCWFPIQVSKARCALPLRWPCWPRLAIFFMSPSQCSSRPPNLCNIAIWSSCAACAMDWI